MFSGLGELIGGREGVVPSLGGLYRDIDLRVRIAQNAMCRNQKLEGRGELEKDRWRARRGLCTSQLPVKGIRSSRTNVSPTSSILLVPSEFPAKCQHREETYQTFGDSSFF